MNRSFDEFLRRRDPKPDILQQAARLLLAEETDDLSPLEMRAEIVEAVGDERAVANAEQRLSQDPAALTAAARAFLASIWAEPDGPVRVTAAIDGADRALPIVEIGIVAVATMYIAYLHYTRGVRKETHRKTVKPDGSGSETVERELYGATGPLSVLGGLFGSVGKPREGGRKEE